MKSDDQKRYRVDVNTLPDHLLVMIQRKPGFPPLSRDREIHLRPQGYCIHLEDEAEMNKCLEKVDDIECLLAFLEVKEYLPPMTNLERDILTHWKYRFTEGKQ